MSKTQLTLKHLDSDSEDYSEGFESDSSFEEIYEIKGDSESNEIVIDKKINHNLDRHDNKISLKDAIIKKNNSPLRLLDDHSDVLKK